MCTGELHVHKSCVLANMRAGAQAQSDFSASTQIWSRPCVCSFCKRDAFHLHVSCNEANSHHLPLHWANSMREGLECLGWSLAAVWECNQALWGAFLRKLWSSAGGDPWQGQGWSLTRGLCSTLWGYGGLWEREIFKEQLELPSLFAFL